MIKPRSNGNTKKALDEINRECGVDSHKVKRQLHRIQKLRRDLEAAVPGLKNTGIASQIADDFIDIAAIANSHLKNLKKLSLAKDTQDRRKKIEEVMITSQIQLVDHYSHHLKSLRKTLPQILKHLK